MFKQPTPNNPIYAMPQLINLQQQQQQQHMDISHMLSPRAPASSAINHYQGFQFSLKSKQPYQDSKLNKFMSILHRNNRIDPNRKSFVVDRKTLESSSSVWKDTQTSLLTAYEQPPPPTTPRQQDHHQRASFVLPPPLIDTPMIESSSPKLSSWLPGLFHFKQPKVCSLECEARDEREAIGKVSQVLQEVYIHHKSYPLASLLTFMIISIWTE